MSAKYCKDFNGCRGVVLGRCQHLFGCLKSRANPQAFATGIMTDLMVIQSEFAQRLWHNAERRKYWCWFKCPRGKG